MRPPPVPHPPGTHATTYVDSSRKYKKHAPPHSNPFAAQFPHRAGWTPYPTTVTANPATQFHSPPPGFQTAFRASAQAATDLLQSAGMDRH
ncbi:hypothetical protein QQF64_035306 [Cirrhinus molitorella]|uniref:Uncharacterized protein n=1 Tax=Cirrhinus molitorella TaxID=172907 RepID=A0ABR3NFG4_9TELE